MDRRKSLINISLTRFTTCAVLILLISTPLFYLLTKHFYAEDMIDLIESVKSGAGVPAVDLEVDIMTGVMIQFGLIVLVLSISLLIIIRLVSKKLWQPFESTLLKTEKFNIERGDVPEFEPADIIEFHKLNNALTQLMNRSVESYRVQKEFTENASHELQTPIAIIQSKLDVLMQKDLDEDQMKIVQDINRTGARISRLNRNLLLLAKIDNNQFESREEINVGEFLENNIKTLGELYGMDNIRYSCDSLSTVTANRSLFEIMVNNLIVNALKNTPDNGYVSIVCHQDRLCVANTSINGQPLDENKIFERFNHSGDANRGTGIGLAIVKTICDYHGWNISYSFDNRIHLFSIRFRPLISLYTLFG
ncbi:MAG: HAMP domain-containing sensor histidine kinase [Bacteroidales bacterium]|nr:HAMP domain-containing sensor histidine kinase [Bacteroidales bacterium]MDD4669401.1 HAMP domain-containing sensor histidine kinase [Bacteroidales bacterium]